MIEILFFPSNAARIYMILNSKMFSSRPGDINFYALFSLRILMMLNNTLISQSFRFVSLCSVLFEVIVCILTPRRRGISANQNKTHESSPIVEHFIVVVNNCDRIWDQDIYGKTFLIDKDFNWTSFDDKNKELHN